MQEQQGLPTRPDTNRDGLTDWRKLALNAILGSLVLLLGIAAFAVSLVWYMPVRFVAHQAGLLESGPVAASRLSGTIWQGRMQLDGRHEVTWTTQTAASLWAFGFAADWEIDGPGSDLTGKIVLRPGGVDLGPLSGSAAWPLIAAALPGLPIACTGEARLAAVEFRLDGTERTGSGTITTSAAECARLDGEVDRVPAPALHAQITTLPNFLQVLVTPQDGARVPLVTARLTSEDRLVITIHQAGAALVPGMPSTADSELDLPLSVLMGG